MASSDEDYGRLQRHDVPNNGLDTGAATPASGPSTLWTHKAKKVGEYTLTQGVYAGEGTGGVGDGKRSHVAINVPTPEIVWGSKVTPGTTGKTTSGGNRPRPDTGVGAAKLYRNDHVTFTAELSKVHDAKNAGIHLLYEQSGSIGQMAATSWKDANTAQWTLTATQPGALRVKTQVKIPGVATELATDYEYKVVMDLTDLTTTCQAASELLQSKFHAASAKPIEAKQAYERAHKKHKDAIKEAHAVGELVLDLLAGAFFAALGGAAGGAVGNLIKGQMTKAMADSALSREIQDDFERACLVGVVQVQRRWCYVEWARFLASQPAIRTLAYSIFRYYPHSGLSAALRAFGAPSLASPPG